MARKKRDKGKRKYRRTALPLLGAAGASLAMAGTASAAAVPAANLPPHSKTTHPVIILGEEELSDVTLATFYVFGRDREGASLGEKLAARGCGGCRGGGGRCAAARCGGARCAAARCARCAAGRCAVARCAVARCAGVRCGVGVVGCAGCSCSCSGCSGPCWSWTGTSWAYVC